MRHDRYELLHDYVNLIEKDLALNTGFTDDVRRNLKRIHDILKEEEKKED